MVAAFASRSAAIFAAASRPYCLLCWFADLLAAILFASAGCALVAGLRSREGGQAIFWSSSNWRRRSSGDVFTRGSRRISRAAIDNDDSHTAALVPQWSKNGLYLPGRTAPRADNAACHGRWPRSDTRARARLARDKQVPDEAMHSRRGRKDSRGTDPVGWHVDFFGVDRLGLVVAEKGRTTFPLSSIMSRTRSRRGMLQPVVDHRAIRRILSGRFFRRQRRVGIVVAAHAIRKLRREKMRGIMTACNLRARTAAAA